jgi:hypothetical protein
MRDIASISVLAVITALPNATTLDALTASAMHINVGWGKFMASLAVRLRRIGFATMEVLFRSDGFQVARINTKSIAAKMVKLHFPRRRVADHQLISNPMGVHVSTGVQPEYAVPTAIGSGPVPAVVLSANVYLRPEPWYRRFRDVSNRFRFHVPIIP